jgi:hypothetical protein
VGFMSNTGSEWRKDGFWGGRKLDPAGDRETEFFVGMLVAAFTNFAERLPTDGKGAKRNS